MDEIKWPKHNRYQFQNGLMDEQCIGIKIRWGSYSFSDLPYYINKILGEDQKSSYKPIQGTLQGWGPSTMPWHQMRTTKEVH